MGELALKVENLGKMYQIGARQEQYPTLRNALVSGLKRLVSKPFGSRTDENTLWALKDVSFEVKQGEVLGIIGRNGAGKSTLLKVLAHITEPTKGRVSLYGRVGSLLEVGTGFHPELTGRDNIYLNGAILGMKKAEVVRKFDEIVAFAEVEKFLDTPVKRYSSGMYVRLAFAVAAHLEPEILVVDEVLAVGDAEFQKKCLGKMGDVAKQGRTVLFVSHNMIAIEALCSRAVVMDHGEAVFDGNSTEGIVNYIHAKNNLKNISLRDRTDRAGTGKVRAVDIKIFNNAEQVTDHVGMGEDFSVEIHTQGKLSKAIIGILVGNVYRAQIMRGYTWEQIADEIELSGDDIIRCYFKGTPLIHGAYDIHIWLGEYPSQCADFVETAIELNIDPKDVFHSGRILNPTGGMVFCEIDWELNGKKLSRSNSR